MDNIIQFPKTVSTDITEQLKAQRIEITQQRKMIENQRKEIIKSIWNDK